MAGTLAISLLNCASAAGAILTGLATDRFHLTSVLILSALISTMSDLFYGVLLLPNPCYSSSLSYMESLLEGTLQHGFGAQRKFIGILKELKLEF